MQTIKHILVGKVQPPILILPATAAYQPFREICFATDTYLRRSDRQDRMV